ncbi:MAG: FKBP-type peptidyl-prolyl cis-trans isomerase, partial [Bacteroidota bacterium]
MTGIISCQKEDDSELIALEERILNAYLENNNISVEPTESGLYFIQETEGTGATPAMDDWVLINYDLYLIHGEQLIYTSEKEKAIEYGIYDSNLIYGPSKNPMGRNIKALDEGLTMMKEGGKATLLFKSDLGFGKQRTGLINPYEPLKIVVEL